ncbi:MAG TPA: hypothetical protein VLF71_04375 [Candidatus Saccharimonadales bacterium]|nr:hypothetical protein [Candidatus Saccharimonadales bacterium]
MRAHKPTFNPRQIIWAGIGILAAAVVVMVLALGMPAIERQLGRRQLLPQHQQLTELSLINPEQLPKTYQSGQNTTVRFQVRNRTTLAQVYTYTITETNPAGNRLARLASGQVTVSANGMATASKTVVPADLSTRVYLKVQLDNGLSVGYWVGR